MKNIQYINIFVNLKLTQTKRDKFHSSKEIFNNASSNMALIGSLTSFDHNKKTFVFQEKVLKIYLGTMFSVKCYYVFPSLSKESTQEHDSFWQISSQTHGTLTSFWFLLKWQIDCELCHLKKMEAIKNDLVNSKSNNEKLNVKLRSTQSFQQYTDLNLI